MFNLQTIIRTLSFIIIPSMTSSYESVNLWNNDDELPKFTNQEYEMHRVSFKGELDPEEISFEPLCYLTNFFTDESFKEKKNHCIFEFTFTDTNFNQLILKKKDVAFDSKIAKGDYTLNLHTQNKILFRTKFKLAEDDNRNCFWFNRMYKQHSLEIIKTIFSESDDPVIMQIVEEIKKKGLVYPLYTFPFDFDTRQAIKEDLIKDSEEYQNEVIKYVKKEEFRNIFLKGVDDFKVKIPRNQILNWRNKLIKYCENWDETECKFSIFYIP